MKIRNFAKHFLAVTFTALLMVAGHARAATISGGSSLLTDGYANQLESWLGEGPITLTNIFTKASGNVASDFHGAVDGKGRTFVVMSATEDGTSAIIGGYNPQSWAGSAGDYNYTYYNADRTAFLFNLSTAAIYRQTLTTVQGSYQSYNSYSYGPTFGSGHDLYVSPELSAGYSFLWSYGELGQKGRSIVDGAEFNGSMAVGGIEVFTISVTPVPEPEIYAMMAVGLGLLGWIGRRRRLRQAAAS